MHRSYTFLLTLDISALVLILNIPETQRPLLSSFTFSVSTFSLTTCDEPQLSRVLKPYKLL
jgi:hypothetical protein